MKGVFPIRPPTLSQFSMKMGLGQFIQQSQSLSDSMSPTYQPDRVMKVCVTNVMHLDEEGCARLYLVLEVLKRLSLKAAMASPGVSG